MATTTAKDNITVLELDHCVGRMAPKLKHVAKLRMTSWNITGIKYNLAFLRKYLALCDICFLQEHWLFPDNLGFLDTVDSQFITWGISSSDINPDSITRRGKGGIAFFWRKSLNASFEVLEEMGNDRIAVLNVKVRNSPELFIIGVYLPCTSESMVIYKRYVEQLENIIYQLHARGTLIIMGDFNAHIGNLGGPRCFGEINSRGLAIRDMIESFELQSINSLNICEGPIETYYTNNGLTKTTVDHIFIPQEQISSILHAAVLEECSSNLSTHMPVSCVLKTQIPRKSCSSYNRKILDWKRIESANCQQKYQDKLSELFSGDYFQDTNIRTESELEHFAECVVTNLKIAANSSVPYKKPKPHLKSYWNSNLTSLNKKAKHFWKTWIKDGRPRGSQYASFKNYKQAKQEFRNAQRRAIFEEESNDFHKLERQYDIDKSVFDNKVTRSCRKTVNNNEFLQIDGKRVESTEELLEVWQNHYENLYTPKEEPGFDNSFKRFVENSLTDYWEKSFNCNDPLDNPFEVAEVADVCMKLPNGKAGGLDTLSYEHIKYGGLILYTLLTKLFNGVLKIEYTPGNWSTGSVISIFKNGKKDKHDKDNYRGITLLNVIGKIFERLVLNRLTPKLNELNIPNSFQYAYQKDKSSVLSSFVLQELVHYNVERSSKVYCCFLDSSKAFDSVWLDGLFFKLFNTGINGKSWRILRKWYEGMRCCVSLNGKSSPFFPVKQGVRQGGVLSPWLYLCFNNDIPNILNATGYGLKLNDIHSDSVLVADDLTLLSVRVDGLQTMINTITDYSNKWRFKFNPGKTVVVTFGETTQKNNVCNKTRKWFLEGKVILEKPTWDHVGITFKW